MCVLVYGPHCHIHVIVKVRMLIRHGLVSKDALRPNGRCRAVLAQSTNGKFLEWPELAENRNIADAVVSLCNMIELKL